MIGYYVHHHGHGHLSRALAVCMHLDEPVVFLSSLARPGGARPGDAWIQLPLDVPDHSELARDVTANGRFHWAPTHVGGLARRAEAIVHALAPVRRLVVDVSVETAVLARLAGVPVTVVAQPGDRGDAAHQLAFDIADGIIAGWTCELYQPPWLAPHAERVHTIGAISRYDGAARPERLGRPRALLLAGSGGHSVPADALNQLKSALPQFDWCAAGGAAAWVDDVWPLVAGADLVVTHAGQSALADIAAAGAAAIVLPQERPFGEQHAMADALRRSEVAVVSSRWPVAADWQQLADQALSAADEKRWGAMGVRGAAQRAAKVIAA